ncbi:tyrosine-type recombinase/integrase [Shouchella patagoniensis]|uniref:tyrosine-type recombinase/integrase n=1 Tax=Shouchella patagoniensis TaxID=228576 RepID=UPI0009951860|nr:tyrosine-type recombinase/integrase [Shouchella patagoniensis]
MANIQQRGKNSYFFTVYFKNSITGKNERKTRTYKVEEEMSPRKLEKHVLNEYQKFEEQVKSGEYVSVSKITFEQFSNLWVANYLDTLEGSTYENHLSKLKNHILPKISDKQIQSIKSIEIINLLKDLKRIDKPDIPLSIRTKQDVYLTLKSIFKFAYQWEVIKSNPMTAVDKPQQKNGIRKTVNYYEEDEVNNLFLLADKESPHWRIFIILLLTTGLRRGEALGLEWSDIDLKEGIMNIDKSITLGRSGKAVVKATKSESSDRLISLPKYVVKELESYKKVWAQYKNNDDWVEEEREWLFCNSNGKHFYPTTPTTFWMRFTKRANVRHIRLHDLRHTSATLLIAQGIHAKIISERLGHKKISTTMDIYGHALRSADRAAADSFDKFFAEKLSD